MTSNQTMNAGQRDDRPISEPWQVGDSSVSTIQEPTIHRGNCQHEQIEWLRSTRERLDAYDGPRWPWMFGFPKECK